MPALYSSVINRSENHHSLQLCDIGLIVIRELEEINEKILESGVLLRELKLLTLKDKNGLNLIIHLRHFER